MNADFHKKFQELQIEIVKQRALALETDVDMMFIVFAVMAQSPIHSVFYLKNGKVLDKSQVKRAENGGMCEYRASLAMEKIAELFDENEMERPLCIKQYFDFRNGDYRAELRYLEKGEDFSVYFDVVKEWHKALEMTYNH